MRLCYFALASAAIFAALPADAAVVFSDKNQPGSLNTVHLDGNASSNVVIGNVNNVQAVVITGTEAIHPSNDGNGQPWVVASDGTLNKLTFSLLNGLLFSEISFNLVPLDAQGNTSWTATLSAISPDGAVNPETFTVKGNQFFDAYTTDGWKITSVTFDTPVNLQGVGQIRISDFSGGTGGAPEPGTWLFMTLGFGLLGAALRHKREDEEYVDG